MLNSSDFFNIGNLSPMSPTPIGDFSFVSACSTGTILQGPVDMNGTFQACIQSCPLLTNDDVTSSVNMLPQPRLLNYRLQPHRINGVHSMGSDSWKMPVKPGLYCGNGYVNIDPMNASHPKEKQTTGSPNGHKYYGGDGQPGNAICTSMHEKITPYEYGRTSSTMEFVGNQRQSHLSQYGKVPVSGNHHSNHPHQQHSTECYIPSSKNVYDSTSSCESGDTNNSCKMSVGLHSSKILHSQQQYGHQQQNFEKQQAHLQPHQQRGQQYGPWQHQQHKFQQQKNRSLHLGYHHTHNHQQQSLSNNRTINHAYAVPRFTCGGQTGSDSSTQQILLQKHSNFFQPQTKQMQPQHEWKLDAHFRGSQLFHQQQNQNQQLKVLSRQDQLQIQPQNNASSIPSDVQTEFEQTSGFKGQEESKPQEKIVYPNQIHCLENQKQVNKPLQRTEQQKLSWPRKESPDETLEILNSEKNDKTTVWNAELSVQSRDDSEDKQNENVMCHDSKCLEDKWQTFHCSTEKQSLTGKVKCNSKCLASGTVVSNHQDSYDHFYPVSAYDCESLAQKCSHSLNHIFNFEEFDTKSTLHDRTENFMDEEKIQESPLKKLKTEHSTASEVQNHFKVGQKFVRSPDRNQLTCQSQPYAQETNYSVLVSLEGMESESLKQEATPVKIDLDVNLQQRYHERCGKFKKDGEAKHGYGQQEHSQSAAENTEVALSKISSRTKKEENEPKPKTPKMAPSSDSSVATKSGKLKVKGISLIEIFTPEQIKDHIAGIQQFSCQNNSNAEYNHYTKHRMKEKTCQLCMDADLKFQPSPIYCTSCGARIRSNATYYTAGAGVTRNYFCLSCYNGIEGDAIGLDGMTYIKSNLEKRRNNEEIEEGWVQCCKCKLWQHQICALFNAKRTEIGHEDYVCPQCYIMEIERGKRKPLPQSAVLGAKDLPKTHLSDHIEERLSRRLKQERKERAASLGKGYDEVPGAEVLIVRVVSAVDKKVEVKQNFLEIVQDEDYPIEFPYRSKVLLLFQKIGGVDVCLFSIYVQEFGSECSHPNHRRISLSYLDSVKYFRPDVKTVTGESLRTFVYHEILIGYLEHCKRRGFTSCYIWACPPIKGEDYILYCHPKIQKTPKSDKLRDWYHNMILKAKEENIVLEVTNFYDYFFTSKDECKAIVTATRLPYFDGDYWPGAIEDALLQLQLGDANFRKQHKKSKKERDTGNWNSNAAHQAGLASSLSKDALLMQKLQESACAMKDDFIMVHMYHTCTHCRSFILSGKRWVCKQCDNFQICDTCLEADEKLDEYDRHPINCKEKHALFPLEVKEIPTDTQDKDEIMESEFFDTRQAFLSLCQGNHYQYDTLRRAKHSSMMILYHLHNPTAPAFASTCNVCDRDIETGQGWRCETCVDFDICSSCYQKDNFMDHPHKLIAHPSIAEYNAQNREARQRRVVQLRKMLDLMVHASRCSSPQCQYPNCRKVKGLFRHGTMCKIRASKGCPQCKKMWYLIQLHGRACKESKCRVPHCKDLKEHFRRLQQQTEFRRRAAAIEIIRQRTADASSKCS